MDFEWDEVKRRSNIANMASISPMSWQLCCDGPALVYRSSVPTAENEERYVAVAKIQEKHVAIVFTRRGATVRIISVRAARREERSRYDQATR